MMGYWSWWWSNNGIWFFITGGVILFILGMYGLYLLLQFALYGPQWVEDILVIATVVILIILIVLRCWASYDTYKEESK